MECFPLRTIKPGYKTRKPWLTEELKDSIKIKNRLFRRQKESTNPEHEVYYKKYRNRLNGKLHQAEKDHYDKPIKKNQGNLKQSWKILKEVINKKKNTTSCSRFVINNTITADKKSIAEAFNSFFVNIGPCLANKIPQDSRSSTTYMKNRILSSMVLDPIIEDEVTTIIRILKYSSAGWDFI